MKTPKKKRRPLVIVDPPPAWSLGRHIRISISEGTPTSAFLRNLIVKKGHTS